MLRAALGRGRDEDYVDYFVRVKRDEWNRYHEQVTPWELQGVPDPVLSMEEVSTWVEARTSEKRAFVR